MEFEYDPAKSAKNLAKHGIDFEAAQRMWDNSTSSSSSPTIHAGIVSVMRFSSGG